MRRVPEECPQEVADMIVCCLEKPPRERPTALDLVRFMANQLGSRLQQELSLSQSLSNDLDGQSPGPRQPMEQHFRADGPHENGMPPFIAGEGRDLDASGRFLHVLSSIVGPFNGPDTGNSEGEESGLDEQPRADRIVSPFQDLTRSELSFAGASYGTS